MHNTSGDTQPSPLRPSRHTWFWRSCGGGYLVATLCVLLVGRGTALAWTLTVAAIADIGIPLLVLSLLVLGFADVHQKRRWIVLAKRGIVLSVCVLALGLPLWASNSVAQYDITIAKQFCDALLPELRRVYAETGRYPEDIGELSAYTTPPWLLRHQAALSFRWCAFQFHDTRSSVICEMGIHGYATGLAIPCR